MGGDALFGYDGVFYTLFLLTPPRGGDKPGNTSSNALGFIFLLTPPRGGRQGYDHQRRANRAISTHAPAWGATATAFCRPLGRFISTHAPARRATLQAAALLHVSVISTHAPAWGATCAGRMSTTMRCSFLLPPLRRGRPVIHDRQRAAVRISTHAPAWGATDTTSSRHTSWIFLLTPPRGGRHKNYRMKVKLMQISTHAPREGGDQAFHTVLQQGRAISTHAPA